MGLKMPRRRIGDAENKLRLLWCLSALGAATPEQLWPFVSDMDLMDYMTFCLFLGELRADGSVAEGRYAMRGVLYVSETGERTLRLLLDKLSPTDRERVTRSAPSYAQRIHERRQARAAHELPLLGMQRARFWLWEDGAQLMDLRLSTPRPELAAEAVRRFGERAPGVLALLYGMPFENEAAPLPVATSVDQALRLDAPALTDMGGGAFLASVPLSGTEAFWSLSLLLPSREAAQGWAREAARQEVRLGARLCRALCGEDWSCNA